MTKYYINQVEVKETEFEEQLFEAITINVEAYFDDMLDDCYPEYKMGNMTFTASQILYKCDRVSYDLAKREQAAYDYTEALRELDREVSMEYEGKVFEKVSE